MASVQTQLLLRVLNRPRPRGLAFDLLQPLRGLVLALPSHALDLLFSLLFLELMRQRGHLALFLLPLRFFAFAFEFAFFLL